jgi:hypothetical protein
MRCCIPGVASNNFYTLATCSTLRPFYIMHTAIRHSYFVNNQLEARLFFMYVYFYSLHVSGSHVPIIWRINCINTTEGFPCFFLICKANNNNNNNNLLTASGLSPGGSGWQCQGKTRNDGSRPAHFHISCYLCCSVYCLCVNVYCHRVTTQLQLINISYHIITSGV